MTRRTDILFVSSLYAPDEIGGAEISVRDLAIEAAGNGFRASVFCTADISSPEIIRVDDVEVYRAPICNIYHPMGQAGSRPAPARAFWHGVNLAIANPFFHAALRRYQPAVISTNSLMGVGSGVWKAARAAGAAVSHFLHDYNLLCVKGTMRNRDANCASLCGMCTGVMATHKARSRHVDLVLSNSEATLAPHIELGFFPAAQKRVVGVAVDVDRFEAAAANKKRRDGSALRVGYLGRVVPEKGVETLIRAMTGQSADSLSLQIAGAGDPAYLRVLTDLAASLGLENVVFLGAVEPAAFLAEIDVLVVPSLWREPFGRTAVEGMSARCLVVAARNGGMAELVRGSRYALSYDGSEAELRAILASLPDRYAVAQDMIVSAQTFARTFARARVANRFYAELATISAKPKVTV